jgi:hypothetical protein
MLKKIESTQISLNANFFKKKIEFNSRIVIYCAL